MDANFFRFIICEGIKYLKNARIEKIFNPIQDVWTFKLSKGINLVFCFGAKRNFLFFSQVKPQNPLQPSTKVGWWRKRIKNRWIEDVIVDWPARKFVLKLNPDKEIDSYILFDLNKGIFLLQDNPIYPCEIKWPPLEDVLTQKEIYRIFPHITSPLRYGLLKISSLEKRQKIYSQIIAGDIPFFYVYEFDNGEREPIISLWEREDLNHEKVVKFDCPIETSEYYGWKILEIINKREIGGDKREKRLKKRLKKQKEKLLKWIELEKYARLIQENLYRFDPNKHYSKIRVQNIEGNKLEIELDPSLSLLENMKSMYKKVKKGKKGLEILENRLKNTSFFRDSKIPLKDLSENFKSSRGPSLPLRLKGIEAKVFLSTDGYYILRGKNQKANHKLLTFGARPHDIWFHVEDGPGAHVIVIIDNPKKEIPEATIIEAAKLAGIASYQKTSKYCRVIGTQVKYVKKKKGMPLGQVEVLKVLYSLNVEIDPLIENKLKIY